jgi:uracil-DNA glycosylase
MTAAAALAAHVEELRACRRCRRMKPPAVPPRPVVSPVYLVGQAPGPREGAAGRPFAWTAGKKLFAWTASLGLDEEAARSRLYIAAVCRCFPGKTREGSDRVPDDREIARCQGWMEREIALLRPRLVVPVGKLAISRFLPETPLVGCVGQRLHTAAFGLDADVIALPHPSGLSTWYKVEPGKTLLAKALRLLGEHEAWRSLLG